MDAECQLPEIKSSDDSDHFNELLAQLPSQYEILGKVNEGGMGCIYKAQNRFTGAVVAIKLLQFEASHDPASIQRFYFEAKAASLLKHHNICRLLDFGVTKGGMPYLVMDWIEGKSLEQRVICDGRLSEKEAVHIFKEVAAALAHAHSKKLMHRDLKPDNIMLSKNADGDLEVQIVDFGIAKFFSDESGVMSEALTRQGLAVGTPKYMSPEQIGGERVDSRTDIYSLGCVLYFALSGKPPFSGNTLVDTLKMHLYEKPAEFNSSLPISPELQKIVFRAMEKKPDQRYASMEEFINQLERLGAHSTDKVRAVVKRSTSQGKLSSIWWFAISFLVISAISMGLQNFLDSSHGKGKTSPTPQKKILSR